MKTAGGLLAALIAAALPVSGQGAHSIAHWKDQGIFLAAIRGLFAGDATLIESGLVGPGYAAITILAMRIFGLGAEEALILVSRVSYLATIFVLYVASRGILARGTFAKGTAEAVALGLSVFFAATNVFGLFSDIPWSHFPATLLLAVLAAIQLRGGGGRIGAAATGFTWMLLFQTRTIEGVAAAVALLVAVLARRLPRDGRLTVREWAHGAASFAAGSAAAYGLTGALTGVWRPVLLYGGTGKDILSLSFGTLPTRLIQFLVDPCYRTLCGETADYLPGASMVFPSDFGIWRFPVSMQAPILLAALAGITLALALAPAKARRRALSVAAFPLTSAAILAGAYLSASYSGSPHLKHGFIRDLMAPGALALLAFVASWAPLQGPAQAGARWSRRGLPLILLLTLTAGFVLARVSGFPRLRSRHFEEIRTEASCGPTECRFAVTGTTATGQKIPIAGLAQFPGCGSTPKGVVRIDGLRVNPAECGERERARLRLIPVEAGLLELPGDALDRVFPHL